MGVLGAKAHLGAKAQNCFAGLENKSASQNLKVNLELYLGTSRSNNDKF